MQSLTKVLEDPGDGLPHDGAPAELQPVAAGQQRVLQGRGAEALGRDVGAQEGAERELGGPARGNTQWVRRCKACVAAAAMWWHGHGMQEQLCRVRPRICSRMQAGPGASWRRRRRVVGKEERIAHTHFKVARLSCHCASAASSPPAPAQRARFHAATHKAHLAE